MKTEIQELEAAITYFETLHHMKMKRGGIIPTEELAALRALREKRMRLLLERRKRGAA